MTANIYQVSSCATHAKPQLEVKGFQLMQKNMEEKKEGTNTAEKKQMEKYYS